MSSHFNSSLNSGGISLWNPTIGSWTPILQVSDVEFLEGCISASFGTHLRAKVIEETPLEECLGILEKIFLDKNPIWARRKAWFDCHQREDESVSQWWDRKVKISKDCDLTKMTTEEICLLQFILGIHKKEKKLKEEMLRIKEPKLDDLLVLARKPCQRVIE